MSKTGSRMPSGQAKKSSKRKSQFSPLPTRPARRRWRENEASCQRDDRLLRHLNGRSRIGRGRPFCFYESRRRNPAGASLAPLPDNLHHLIEQPPIGGDGVSATNSRLPIPVREGPSRLPQDRQQRRAVPDAHHRIEHHLRPPRRDQNVAVTITPTPVHPCGGDQMTEGRLPPIRLEAGAIGIQEQRLLQLIYAGDRSAGKFATPRTTSPSTSSPSRMPKSGTPWRKEAVPSSGSMIQVQPESLCCSPNSSPRMP